MVLFPSLQKHWRPFPFHKAGDALMIFNIQFPHDLNPYLLLHLCDKLRITLNDPLLECDVLEFLV